MLFLLTNDDGIDAPGLQALFDAAKDFGRIVVAAPDRGFSGCGHQSTAHTPIPVATKAPDRHCVSGTPVDCVRLGLHLMRERPTFVLSGINFGSNLGVDVFHSGTVAAAREAALQGIAAVAISQHRTSGFDVQWDDTTRRVRSVIAALVRVPVPDGAYWNVNLPASHFGPDAAPPQLVQCPLDLSPMPTTYEETADGYIYRGVYRDRPRLRGGDIDICFSGNVSVTKMIDCAK